MSDPFNRDDGQELLVRAVGGDRLALGQQLLRHGPVLMARVASRLPHRLQGTCSPADIVQETYRVAIANFSNWHGTSEQAFTVWLIRIADFVCQRTTSKHSAMKRGRDWQCVANWGGGSAVLQQANQTALGRSIVDFNSGSCCLRRKETVQGVATAVAQLPRGQRSAVRLHCIQQLDLATTAREMGRTEASVRALLHRARLRLRSVLEPFT